MPHTEEKHRDNDDEDEDDALRHEGEPEEEDLGYFGHIMRRTEEEPSEEQLQARQDEDEQNVHSVAFREPQVKQIISPHSFSILANAEPRVELAAPVVAQAREVFRSAVGGDKDSQGPGTVPRDRIVSLLVSMGYDFDQNLMAKAVDRLSGQRQEFDEDEWCMLLEDYHAPAYHYGQILRKYCGRDEIDQVEELLVRGCDVNSGDGEGLTPLHYAAELNRVRIINTLSELSNGRLNVCAQDKYGWSPLHSASHQGNTDAVQALLRLGADASSVDKYGKTPLHYAAAQVRVRCQFTDLYRAYLIYICNNTVSYDCFLLIFTLSP
jgi:hypothetical protein